MASQQQQQGSSNPPRPGPSQADREAHELSTQGYTILSLTQLCSAAEAAKAKRKAYKSERKKQADKRNAFHACNNKDRIIQAKSFEIQDLCARIEDMKEEQQDLLDRLDGIEARHQREIDLMTGLKDLKIQMLQVDIEEEQSLVEEYKAAEKKMKREHAAELESRDLMQDILLVDLRELVQVYDEGVEVLKGTIDRQALPPDYSSINNLTPVIALKDTGSATPEHTIATAISSLRKVLAAAPSDSCNNHLAHIANTLHTSLLTIKQGFTSHLWPLSATSASLHATHECVDRVIHFMSLHPDLWDQSLPSSPFLCHIPGLVKSPSTLLRRAFSCADTLALELCSLHFASGGRRAGLMLPVRPLSLDTAMLDSENNEIDTNDDLSELQYWKKKFECMRREALEWKEDVGITVFGDTIAWLEQELMGLV